MSSLSPTLNRCQVEHTHKCIYWGVKGQDRIYMKDLGKKFVRTMPAPDLKFSCIPKEPTEEAIEKAAYVFKEIDVGHYGLVREDGTNPLYIHNWMDTHWIEVETFKKNLHDTHVICIGPKPVEKPPLSLGKKLDFSDIGHLVIRLAPSSTGDRSYLFSNLSLFHDLSAAVCITAIKLDGIYIKSACSDFIHKLPDEMNDSHWIKVDKLFQILR